MIAELITRVFSVIFTTIVLGLSVSAVKWQVYGSAPATTTYGAFVGAFGLLIALIGLAAVWISAIPAAIMAIADTLSSLLLLASGIAFAVGIKGLNCSNILKSSLNADAKLIDGGYQKVKGGYNIGYRDQKPLQNHCKQIEADTVFVFLAFATAAASAALCVLSSRGRSSVGRHSAV